MAKTKRPHEAETVGPTDDIHPSRKKRVKYSNEDAELAKIYNHLADEVQDVRIKAASELIKNLSIDIPDRTERQNAAEARLVRGLTSGRKAARLGFSVALAELVRLKAKTNGVASLPVDLDNIVQFTTPQGNVSGQERRDYLLGRRFAFQAVLQSDIGLTRDLSSDEWNRLIGAVFDLAAEKPWLRRECGSMLYEYLVSHKADLKKSRVQAVVDTAVERNLLKTPEGVGLWIFVQGYFPKVKLPNGIWNHNSPLTSQERQILAKILLEDATGDEPVAKKSGSRQSHPSFVWAVILQELVLQSDPKKLSKFWESSVVSTMFSPTCSSERRSLGLQIVALALSLDLTNDTLSIVLHSNVIKCIVDQRSQSDRYLHDAAKSTLDKMAALAKRKPDVASSIVIELTSHNAFDQTTKTKAIENVISEASDQALTEITKAILRTIEDTSTKPRDDNEIQIMRLVELIGKIVRAHKSSRESLPNTPPTAAPSNWLLRTLYGLSDLAYRVALPSSSQSKIRAKLASCLNDLIDSPLEQAANAPSLTMQHILRDIEKLDANLGAKNSLRQAKVYIKRSQESDNHAFALLISLSALEVLNGEPESIAVYQDVMSCYKAKEDNDSTDESITLLIELLLSFISKQSKLFGNLAKRVFSSLTSDMTAESLQSLLDILDQKESLSGQKELFQEHDENQPNGEDENDQMLDVDDLSDVELVNGQMPSEDDDSDEESSDADTSDEQSEAGLGTGADDDDEEAAFDQKLKEALGTAIADDSDDDGSDMDDDQMEAINPHLESIFKERQKNTSKKQEKKEAKENIVNFKNRVLDLIDVYLKAEAGSVLAIDAILPLLRLIRTTTSPQLRSKASDCLIRYFETSKKKKSLPQPEDHEACFAVLAAVHAEIRLGESHIHATACSRSSLFTSKVMFALDRKYYHRVKAMYNDLESEWFFNAQSKIQTSIFSDWTNWLQSMRKPT